MKLAPLDLLAALALLGVIVLAALHVDHDTLDQVVVVLVSAAAGRALPALPRRKATP